VLLKDVKVYAASGWLAVVPEISLHFPGDLGADGSGLTL
jgi:hypothetical protein